MGRSHRCTPPLRYTAVMAASPTSLVAALWSAPVRNGHARQTGGEQRSGDRRKFVIASRALGPAVKCITQKLLPDY